MRNRHGRPHPVILSTVCPHLFRSRPDSDSSNLFHPSRGRGWVMSRIRTASATSWLVLLFEALLLLPIPACHVAPFSRSDQQVLDDELAKKVKNTLLESKRLNSEIDGRTAQPMVLDHRGIGSLASLPGMLPGSMYGRRMARVSVPVEVSQLSSP